MQILISQINLLICLVNDILDCRLIEQGKFKQQLIRFNPIETFEFIISLFKH